jgi:hypothetical protein
LACSLFLNFKAREDLVASAQFHGMLGYVLGALGILIVIAAIPLGIYLDRQKKARKRQLLEDEFDE